MRDEAGFTAWARQAQPGLLRAAFLLTGDAGHAEDLVQEALTKVALRWGRLAGENPMAYARTVIYRDHVSWWRRRRILEHPTDRVPETPVQDGVNLDRGAVLNALTQLSPRQRQVVVMRYFEDLTEKDCAAVLGISVGTVKSVHHDALEALRLKAPELVHIYEGVS